MTFVIWASARSAAPQKKEVAVTFFAPQAAPPPPPPPPPARSTSQKTTHQVKPKTDAIVKPKDEKPQEEKPEEDQPGEDQGVEGGVAGGVAGGVVGGVVGGQLGSPTPVPKPTNTVIPFGAGMTNPSRIGGGPPQISKEALAARVRGVVIARCVLGVDGRLTGCRIIKGLPYMDQATLAALAGQRWTPVIFEGHPQAVDYTLTFRFVDQ